ncbi:hypothetical protein Tco_0161124 [Tanacetum coccineum]
MHHHQGHHLYIYSLLTVEQTDPRLPYRLETLVLGTREIMRDLERDVGYGIIDTLDEMLVDMLGAPRTDDTEMGPRMIEFTTRVRQDTDEIYTRLDDEQSERQLMAGRLNMLYRDRHAHARIARLMEAEARITTSSDYKTTGSRPQETGVYYRDAGDRPQETEAVHRGIV